MATSLTQIPTQLTAGDTWTWTVSDATYPADAGWSLTYILINSTHKISFAATASGADHLVAVAKATTETYTAGTYGVRCFVSSATERFLHYSATVEILDDPVAATSLDTRSQARKMVEAFDAAGIGSDPGIRQITVDGTLIEYATPTEATRSRAYWQNVLWREEHPGQLVPPVTLNYRDRYGN